MEIPLPRPPKIEVLDDPHFQLCPGRSISALRNQSHSINFKLTSGPLFRRSECSHIRESCNFPAVGFSAPKTHSRIGLKKVPFFERFLQYFAFCKILRGHRVFVNFRGAHAAVACFCFLRKRPGFAQFAHAVLVTAPSVFGLSELTHYPHFARSVGFSILLLRRSYFVGLLAIPFTCRRQMGMADPHYVLSPPVRWRLTVGPNRPLELSVDLAPTPSPPRTASTKFAETLSATQIE
jgi:hypothetical protein